MNKESYLDEIQFILEAVRKERQHAWWEVRWIFHCDSRPARKLLLTREPKKYNNWLLFSDLLISWTMLLLILQITSCCKSFQSDFIDIKKNSPAEAVFQIPSSLQKHCFFFCHRTARSYNYIYKGTALSATKHISKTFWANLTSAPTVSIVTKKQ